MFLIWNPEKYGFHVISRFLWISLQPSLGTRMRPLPEVRLSPHGWHRSRGKSPKRMMGMITDGFLRVLQFLLVYFMNKNKKQLNRRFQKQATNNGPCCCFDTKWFSQVFSFHMFSHHRIASSSLYHGPIMAAASARHFFGHFCWASSGTIDPAFSCGEVRLRWTLRLYITHRCKMALISTSRIEPPMREGWRRRAARSQFHVVYREFQVMGYDSPW